MNACSGVRSSRPARLFSFGLLDGLPVRLRRPYVRAASAGFRLERLATAFMNSPGLGLPAEWHNLTVHSLGAGLRAAWLGHDAACQCACISCPVVLEGTEQGHDGAARYDRSG